MADRGEADRRAIRQRVAIAIASLSIHAAIVWLTPRAELGTRAQDPDVELAPIELVQWQPPPESPKPEPIREPEIIEPTQPPPDEATPPEPTKPERPSLAPREPSASAGPDVPTPPVEPPPAPAPPDGGSDAAALPLSTRKNGTGPITSPRLSGRDLRDSAGTKQGPAAPPVASDHNDAAPQSLADAGFERNRKGDLVYEDPLGHFKATLMPDGRVKFRDFAVARGSIRSGGKVMGMSEIVRSAQGKDLWFLDKRKLLARTEKLRLAMAIKWAEAQVQSRLRQLYRDLLEIWTDADRTVVQRRERLFQRWDECVEAMTVEVADDFGDAPKSSLDELRETAGGEARASIEAFIRKHLPKNSEDAYPPDELRELNRRRHSEAAFDPYSRGS